MSATGANQPSHIPLPISIRNADMRDLTTIAELLTDAFHGNRGLYSWLHPVLKLGIYEDLRHRLVATTAHYACLVATNNSSLAGEDLVGTVEVSVRSLWNPLGLSVFFLELQYPKSYVYVSNLAVDLDYRRQGIAKKLLQTCEAKAIQWGFQDIYLHVLDNNREARQLYLNLGYQFKRKESSWSWLWFPQPNRLLLHKSLQ